MEILALKKLFLQQVKEKGIGEKSYSTLSPSHREMLQKKGGTYFLKPEFRKAIKVAMTGGVFDIIHPGHIYTLNEAKKYGDILVAAIATDETVKKIKKREPMHPQSQRCKMVNALKPVDLAIEGCKDWRQTLSRVSPDTVIFGYDQKERKIAGIKTIKLDKFIEHENCKTGRVRDYLGI